MVGRRFSTRIGYGPDWTDKGSLQWTFLGTYTLCQNLSNQKGIAAMDVHGGFQRHLDHLEIWGRRNSSDDCPLPCPLVQQSLHFFRWHAEAAEAAEVRTDWISPPSWFKTKQDWIPKIRRHGFHWFPTANCSVNFSGNPATRHDAGITESLRSTRSLGSNVFSCIFPRTEFSGCSLAINLAATCVVNQVYVEGWEICQIVAEISSELVAIKVCHHESHESCSADPF